MLRVVDDVRRGEWRAIYFSSITHLLYTPTRPPLTRG